MSPKQKKLVVDLQRSWEAVLPLTINGEEVERVDSLNFLGTTISSKWDDSILSIINKVHQRLLFLRNLKKFGASREEMLQFYRAAIKSVCTFSLSV